MSKSAAHVLKNDEVQLEGRFQLDAAQAHSGKPRQISPALTTPQVRILENNQEYAVIGVICSCGTEMSIRCDYADARTSEHPQT